jgi:predicted CoA-binding protein
METTILNEPELIARSLRETKTIAVVGLTDSPGRASYGVSRYMQQAGYRIVPVNPTVESILGEKAHRSLGDIPFKVEMVNVFRAPRYVSAIVDEVVRLSIPFLWLQEGVIDAEAAARAEAAGVGVVMDRCLYKEHARLR